MLNVIATPYEIDDIKKLKEAGATSVVISTPFFSARGAHLFALEQLKPLKEACMQHGLFMYVQVNRFFTQAELEALRDHLSHLLELDVDGIYYGDEGVLYEAQKLGIQHKLIYNPDTLITNKEDVQYYLDEGIKMVTLSKEITLEEICEIAHHVQGDVEVVIHGRLNMMHSKRKLVSNYLDFIGNHVDVRQHKQLYIMEETRDEHMPIIEDDLGTHVFTGFTLASFEELPVLIAEGVHHVRIDGIFHDIAYVCEAVRQYRAIEQQGIDGNAVFEAYQLKYPQDHVTKGFYYTKTSKVK